MKKALEFVHCPSGNKYGSAASSPYVPFYNYRLGPETEGSTIARSSSRYDEYVFSTIGCKPTMFSTQTVLLL